MRTIGGILAVLGELYVIASDVLLGTWESASGIVLLVLGLVVIAGALSALTRLNYVLALTGAICLVVAGVLVLFLSLGGLMLYFIIGAIVNDIY